MEQRGAPHSAYLGTLLDTTLGHEGRFPSQQVIRDQLDELEIFVSADGSFVDITRVIGHTVQVTSPMIRGPNNTTGHGPSLAAA